jgi:hypothetical protein
MLWPVLTLALFVAILAAGIAAIVVRPKVLDLGAVSRNWIAQHVREE